jgi:hypothetical protein
MRYFAGVWKTHEWPHHFNNRDSLVYNASLSTFICNAMTTSSQGNKRSCIMCIDFASVATIFFLTLELFWQSVFVLFYQTQNIFVPLIKTIRVERPFQIWKWCYCLTQTLSWCFNWGHYHLESLSNSVLL